MSITTFNSKINHIFVLLELLAKGEELYPQNEQLQERLFSQSGPSKERTLRRYLQEIHDLYSHIVITEKARKEFCDKKVTLYRVVNTKKDVSEVLRYFIENSSDLSWLLQLVHENNPTLLNDLHGYRHIEACVKADKEIFLFKSNPFESFDTESSQKIFSQIKNAVKGREYRTIHYYCDKRLIVLEHLKCLKLIFMSNNWYLATENDAKKLRMLRVNFIRAVAYTARHKSTNYRNSVLQRYQGFFQTIQNPMTLNKPFKTARLHASEKVALYFKEEMKPFFPSQKFIEQYRDGSVAFSIDYTQPIEILPFIKQWQPDLRIETPLELRDLLVADLRQGILNQ